MAATKKPAKLASSKSSGKDAVAVRLTARTCKTCVEPIEVNKVRTIVTLSHPDGVHTVKTRTFYCTSCIGKAA